jgi:hypothetical protein
MKLYVIHIGEADLDDGTQIQQGWIVPKHVAESIAQSLGQPMREYLASKDQARAIGDTMTATGVATLDNTGS